MEGLLSTVPTQSSLSFNLKIKRVGEEEKLYIIYKIYFQSKIACDLEIQYVFTHL